MPGDSVPDTVTGSKGVPEPDSYLPHLPTLGLLGPMDVVHRTGYISRRRLVTAHPHTLTVNRAVRLFVISVWLFLVGQVYQHLVRLDLRQRKNRDRDNNVGSVGLKN